MDTRLDIPNEPVPPISEEQIITEDTIILQDRSGGNSGGQKMSRSQYLAIENVATKGNVLITKDNTTFGVQHGHAGIMYTNCSSTIEALGYGYLSQWQWLSTWENHYQVRLYYPSNVTESNRYAAAEYAKFSLQGKSYSLQPYITSTTELNCATLVWQAYFYGGNKYFAYNSLNSLKPQNIVEWWGMEQKVSVNWAGTGW